MSNKISTQIMGQITFVKEYINKNNKPGKTYTVGFIGGTFFSLFAKEGLELVNGDKGLFEIEFKLSELKDDKGYKKTAYVPSTILDFSLEAVGAK